MAVIQLFYMPLIDPLFGIIKLLVVTLYTKDISDAYLPHFNKMP